MSCLLFDPSVMSEGLETKVQSMPRAGGAEQGTGHTCSLVSGSRVSSLKALHLALSQPRTLPTNF